MVAQITEGTAFDKQGRPFRRRNFMPGILMFAALAVATLIIWVIALNRPADVAEAAACNPPADAAADPTQSKLGEQVDRAAMTEVGPANLADAKVRVLNASGQGGQAGEVAGQLRDLGFAEPTAANDPLYENNRLSCQGQIRFGPQRPGGSRGGLAGRPMRRAVPGPTADDTVDLAIGTDFTELARSDDIEAVLSSLRPEATQPADPSLLSKIHSATC